MRTRESSLLLLSVAVNISVFLCINNKYHCVRGNVQIEEWQFRDGQYCYLALLLTADFVKNHKRIKIVSDICKYSLCSCHQNHTIIVKKTLH